MTPVGGVSSGGRGWVEMRGYGLRGDAAAPAPSQRGDSANAAGGISADGDTFTPSFRLTDEEEKVVADLQRRDREVRAHEQAHISAGGAYVRGGASYEYERGPDGKRYAVGGEVSIDSSPVRDNPEATITKMQIVRAAALAPAEPSAQDRAVAASASREEASARMELRERRAAEAEEQADERAESAAEDEQDTAAGNAPAPSSRMAAAISAYAGTNNPLTNAGGINFAA